MYKDLKFEKSARNAMLDGLKKLSFAVSCTLGPKGRNVVIHNDMYPHVTKDGVSIAKSLKLKNKFEDVGLQIVKNASVKTCDDAGDGTTTSVVLADSIITFGMMYLNAGMNPNELNAQMDSAVEKVVAYIKENSSDSDKYEEIATISSNNNEEIGKLVGEAFTKVGKHGVISIESSRNMETSIEYVEGLTIDRGYVSPYFVSNGEEMIWEAENPVILSYKGKLTDINNILYKLEEAVSKRKPVLIMVDDIDSTVIDTLVLNKIRNNVNMCVIKAPFDNMFRSCVDVVIGADPEKYSAGSCDKVIVSNTSTSIINGHGNASDLEYLRTVVTDENLLSKVFGGAAIIKVGAASEIEMLEKKDRIEDAVCAVRAASEEGVVIGGGYTYAKASLNLSDEIPGEQVIKKALQEPLLCICKNAGIDGKVILDEVLKHGVVFNAKSGKYEQTDNCKICDPAKVARVALQNATSVAKMFLTTDCVICDD